MCRIAGIIEKQLSDEASNKLNSMVRSLIHGGPDDGGVFEENGVHFGHRRLSILDLSPLGHQPMRTADGDIIITYNGEVFNFHSIREELQKKGYRFQSATDTEVILNAWKEWGAESFSRFNGMFALAIYDRRNQKIILARDHAGIKPLYYSFDNEKLVFASEVRAFKQYNHQWPENPDWKALFLTFGSLPFPFTTLKGVQMLPKGSYLKLDLQNFDCQLIQFQKFSFSSIITDPEEAEFLIREQMIEAVKRHLISDAPIGIFLSGGIDSSLLALIADKLGTDQLRTLSVTFNEASFDESPFQQMVLGRIHSKHTAYRVDEQMFLENLDDVFQAMDQPSIDGVNTYFVSKCARETGLKAVLSGLGADEFFGGYGSFKRISAMNQIKKLPGKKWIARSLGSVKDEFKRIAWLDLNSTVGDYLFLRGIYSSDTTARLLETSEEDIWNIVRKVTISGAPDINSPNYASFLETNVYMENQLLKDSDAMSMWHGLEVRVPFLDKELIALAMKTAPTIKFRQERPKYLLTHTFRDLLPDGVVFRQKQGFSFPLEKWLKNNNKRINEMIHSSSVTNELHQKFSQGSLHWSKYWTLAVMNQFNDQVIADPKSQSIIV